MNIPFPVLTDEIVVLEWPGSSVQTHTMVTYNGSNTTLSCNKMFLKIFAKLPGYPVLDWMKRLVFPSESKRINRKISNDIRRYSYHCIVLSSFLLLTCLAKAAMSSLNDSEEQTSL